MSKIRAVFFDMDGVLVDSMPYHFFAWYTALRRYGILVNSQDIYRHEGEKWEDTLAYFWRQNKRPVDTGLLRKVFNYRQKVFHKIFRRQLMPDAPELAAALKTRGYLLGVVSGTPVRDIKWLLPRPLWRLFDCITGGDSAARGKPDPEPYLQTAARLALPPAACLVIENAPLGIAAAKAAGMTCLAVTTSLPAEYLPADRVCHIRDLRENLQLML